MKLAFKSHNSDKRHISIGIVDTVILSMITSSNLSHHIRQPRWTHTKS